LPLDVDAIRTALEAKRAELTGELEGLTAVPVQPPGAVSFGKRIGDGTTEAVERLNTTGAARQIYAMLTEVERALVRLEEGTYGICECCARSIPADRLEARPWSTSCVRCSRSR
jgi:RNA polymerase-binding transcription factor DksA